MVVGWMTGGTWSRLCKAGQVPGGSIEGLVAETKVGLCWWCWCWVTSCKTYLITLGHPGYATTGLLLNLVNYVLCKWTPVLIETTGTLTLEIQIQIKFWNQHKISCRVGPTQSAQLEHGAWQGRLGFRLQGWSETKVVRRTDGQVNRRSVVVFRWLDSHSGEKEEKDRGKCNFRTNCKPSAISRTSLSEFPAQPTDQQPIGRNSQFLIALRLQHGDVLANFDECLHQGWHWYQHQWQKDSTHLSVYAVPWCIWGRKFNWLLTENSKLWHTPSDNQSSISLCSEVVH